MDRPEPGLVKWSPNPGHNSFLHVNLQRRVVQIYEPTGHAQHGRFDFKKVSKHDDSPPLTTYDWSSANPGLVAVGTSNGLVNLLRVDDNSNAYLELDLRIQRLCQAVAFNTGTLLSVGLERVRNDQCLHIWDISRVSEFDPHSSGFTIRDSKDWEPINRLEPSLSVSSLKFFEDEPQTLAIGIKNSGVRIYDLRDPHGAVITFQTKCNNNIAIDYKDPNYFASSALDQPGVMVWDRRATSRSTVSEVYLEAVDRDDLPWGSALRLDRVIDVQPEQFADKHSLIRSIRFCRDHRGLLAVLSRTGQLNVVETRKEYKEDTTPHLDPEDTPELLEARRSYELDLSYSDQDKRNDRIVSFDFVTLDSPVLTPRVIVLRANGHFDILEKPSSSSDHVYKMVPWQPPYRGFEEGSSYHGLMRFEPSQSPEMMGSRLIDQALSDFPVFPKDEATMFSMVSRALEGDQPDVNSAEDSATPTTSLPDLFTNGATTAEKLRSLRNHFKESVNTAAGKTTSKSERQPSDLEELTQKMAGLSAARAGPPSNRQLHERLLGLTAEMKRSPKEAQILLDHIKLLRAKEKYMFDSDMNRDIVSDDPWLKDMWDWISGAEQYAADSGMVSRMTDPEMDLSYMGVYSIWTNDLGNRPSARLSNGSAVSPEAAVWERCLHEINKKFDIRKFKGAKTAWPAHRQLCTSITLWGQSQQMSSADYAKPPANERNSSWHTTKTARALFSGQTEDAIQILKKASSDHPELLFVSLALQLARRGDVDLAKEQLDFDETIASKTDPYLRAISTLIATNDWEMIANQDSLPLRERTYIALRYFEDDQLTEWLNKQVSQAIANGDIEGIVLTGITDKLVDIFANYVEKFNDVQTATLVLSICAPLYIDDYRCVAWRNAYRAYLQRHKAFYQRAKFEVESTKKSKRGNVPTIKPPSRQIALRCVYCDAEYELSRPGGPASASASSAPPPLLQSSSSSTGQRTNQLMVAGVNAGVCCPTCGRHLPRCVVCLEVVGISRSDRPESSQDRETRVAARFPTFCLKCEHVLHLDHARQWFARHIECPVPECRCRCNFRANQELNYH